MEQIKAQLYQSSSGSSGISSGNSSSTGDFGDKNFPPSPFMSAKTVLQLFAPIRSELKTTQKRFDLLTSNINVNESGQACLSDANDALEYFVRCFDQLTKLHESKASMDSLPVSFSIGVVFLF